MIAAAAITCCCCPRTACLICSIQAYTSSDLLSPGVAEGVDVTCGARGADTIDRVPTRLRRLIAGNMLVMRCLHERAVIAGGASGFDAFRDTGVCRVCHVQFSAGSSFAGFSFTCPVP